MNNLDLYCGTLQRDGRRRGNKREKMKYYSALRRYINGTRTRGYWDRRILARRPLSKRVRRFPINLVETRHEKTRGERHLSAPGEGSKTREESFFFFFFKKRKRSYNAV